MGSIHLHDFLVHLFFVIFVFLPYLLHLGLQFFHLLHRHIAFVGKGPEKNFNQDSQYDDVHSVVMGKTVGELEELEKGLGNDIKPAVINHVLKLGIGGL